MTDLPFRIGLAEHPDVVAVAPRRAAWLLRAVLAVALVGAVAWLGYAIAFSRGLDQLHAAAQQRLAGEAAQPDGALPRFGYLSPLLEPSPDVFRLLGNPDNRALQQSVSLYL